jgi:O-antigen ligase
LKWLALSIGLMAIIPLAGWIRANPRHSLKIWMLLGFLPFVTSYFHFYMAAYSASEWGGYVKGAEISIIDIIAMSLYLNLPRTRESLPFRYLMALYFVAALISAIQALAPIQSLFFPWQLARMFLLYATVARGCVDYRVTRAIMKGMAFAIIFETLFVIWQRFGLGLVQTPGTLGHQNLLGIMSHFVTLPFFALLLSNARGKLPAVAVLSGALLGVSTASRATIGLLAVGLAGIFSFSAMGKWTSRKATVLLVGALASAVLAPAAMAALEHRFEVVPLGDQEGEDSYDERGAYKSVAAAMLDDHPFGIGANHFTVIGNVGGYFERSKLGAYTLARSGNVHNIYYLVAAETGYPGLIAVLLLLGAPLFVALRCGWRNLGDERGDLLLGLGVSLLAVYVHSWEEWSLATFSAEYLLAITMGLVAANAQQLGYWKNFRQIKPQKPIVPSWVRTDVNFN